MEGYIKFNIEWRNEAIEQEINIDELLAIRREMYARGYIGMISGGIGFGNVSQRISDDRFIISGTQTGGLPELTINDFARVDSWDLDSNSLSCTGKRKASSESLTHGAIYSALPDTLYVVHIHCKPLWESLLYKIPTTPEYAEFGTPELAREIMKITLSRENCGAIALAGHEDGLVYYGDSAKLLERIPK
jgi:hypothetical protein